MDTSANVRQKAPTGMGKVHAVLVTAIALALLGCETIPPSPRASVAPPPVVEAKGAQVLAVAPKQPEAAPKPAAIPPHQTPPPSQPKPAPVVAAKGAENLSAPHTLPASHTRAPMTATANPVGKPAPVESNAPIAQASDMATSAPVAELIVKGPPHPVQSRSLSRKAAAWIGLGLFGAIVAVVVSLQVIRRPQPVEGGEGKKMDPMRADGLLMKEPLNQPCEVAESVKS